MKDLFLDTDGDLMITGDDFVINTSDLQHQEHLLISEKGAFKQSPGTGVGLFTYTENEEPAEMLREVSIQFSADGMTVSKVAIEDDKSLKIEAQYK